VGIRSAFELHRHSWIAQPKWSENEDKGKMFVGLKSPNVWTGKSDEGPTLKDNNALKEKGSITMQRVLGSPILYNDTSKF
jgi:hypothetical protein